MNYLIAVDLEGVNHVVGEQNKGLGKDVADYAVATAEAVRELNVIVSALFEQGAENVYVWDNHGSGNNLDFGAVDKRAVNVGLDACSLERMNFADGLNIGGLIFLGYHAKEGAFDAVLAHTYSSVAVQYIKIGGKQAGEFFIDSAIAAAKDIPVIMLVGDDKCVEEAREVSDKIVTVVTKTATGRNSAVFKPDEELKKELCEKTKEAAKLQGSFNRLSFPVDVEMRFTRTELCKSKKDAAADCGLTVKYGEDAHILAFTASKIEDIKFFL